LIDSNQADEIRRVIDHKTKPPGSLGRLEELAYQIAAWQGTTEPGLHRPTILVFAGDHGASVHPLSAFPREVTRQMVLNFLSGGAAINVFARQNGMELRVIDCGILGSPIEHSNLISARIGPGTADYLQEDAMTRKELQQCELHGRRIIQELSQRNCNVVGFGEMGISNTSSASLIMHFLTGLPLEECVGPGTGLDSEAISKKYDLLSTAANRRPDLREANEVLQAFGGFEIAQMAYAMCEAHRQGMLVLVDGFISSVAYLAAGRMVPELQEAALFCHESAETAHSSLLQCFGARPILELNMRLGEGTGVAMAYPIIRNAVAFINEMASFESAGVTDGMTVTPPGVT
jgi:nicotinate-nucleotide--dimethylbenzimidazole phosphoribosyltransferase